MDNFKYTYSVARINALSTKLLDKEFASRILAAEPEEILNILRETALAESFTGIEKPFEVEIGLRKDLRKAYDLYESVCPNKKASQLFRYRHDYHNLKAMLKAKIRAIPHDEFLLDLCTVDADKLAAAVSESTYRLVPDHLRDAAVEAIAEHDRTGSMAAISYTCDRLMWQYIMQKARETREKIVVELFREYVNLANLKSFFRFREFSDDAEVFKRHFIPEGSYSLDFFLHYMDEELGLFLDHLAKTRYEQEIVTQGLRAWPEEKSFWRLEKASDNFLLRHFSSMRHQFFSIAPLIYYLLRKIAETRLIRTVIRCKAIGMPRAMIEDRLRYIYV
jgi:V/A-type H+-transporting ATPase subunit C